MVSDKYKEPFSFFRLTIPWTYTTTLFRKLTAQSPETKIKVKVISVDVNKTRVHWNGRLTPKSCPSPCRFREPTEKFWYLWVTGSFKTIYRGGGRGKGSSRTGVVTCHVMSLGVKDCLRTISGVYTTYLFIRWPDVIKVFRKVQIIGNSTTLEKVFMLI